MKNEKDESKSKIINKRSQSIISYIIVVLILIVIIALVIYFLNKDNRTDNTNNVVTNEVESEISEDEYPPQEPEVKDFDIAAIAYDTYNQENVVFKNITLGGDVAYSIDYGAPETTANLMTARKYLSDQGMAILMNGYPNCTPEEMGLANTNEAYMSTQMAIWEVMNRTGESKKAMKIFRVENIEPIAGNEEVCNRVINVANNLVSKAENEPYTDVPVMHLDNANISIAKEIGEESLIGPYTITIQGTAPDTIDYIRASLENAPASAMVTDENGNEKTELASGDQVYVKINNQEEDATFDIKFEALVNRKIGLIYEEVNTENQDYLKLGTQIDDLEVKSTIEWSTIVTIGKIEVTVEDNNNNPIVGARIALKSTDGKTYGEVESGTDGKIMFYSVPVGEYVLEQVDVPEEYEVTQIERAKKITVNGGETTILTFVDKKTE